MFDLDREQHMQPPGPEADASRARVADWLASLPNDTDIPPLPPHPSPILTHHAGAFPFSELSTLRQAPPLITSATSSDFQNNPQHIVLNHQPHVQNAVRAPGRRAVLRAPVSKQFIPPPPPPPPNADLQQRDGHGYQNPAIAVASHSHHPVERTSTLPQRQESLQSHSLVQRQVEAFSRLCDQSRPTIEQSGPINVRSSLQAPLPLRKHQTPQTPDFGVNPFEAVSQSLFYEESPVQNVVDIQCSREDIEKMDAGCEHRRSSEAALYRISSLSISDPTKRKPLQSNQQQHLPGHDGQNTASSHDDCFALFEASNSVHTPVTWPVWADLLISRIVHLPTEERDRIADVIKSVVRVALLVGIQDPPKMSSNSSGLSRLWSAANQCPGGTRRVANIGRVVTDWREAESSDGQRIGEMESLDDMCSHGHMHGVDGMIQDVVAAANGAGTNLVTNSLLTGYYIEPTVGSTNEIFGVLRDTLAYLRIHVGAAADAARAMEESSHDPISTVCELDEFGDFVNKSNFAQQTSDAVDFADDPFVATCASTPVKDDSQWISDKLDVNVANAIVSDTKLVSVLSPTPDSVNPPDSDISSSINRYSRPVPLGIDVVPSASSSNSKLFSLYCTTSKSNGQSVSNLYSPPKTRRRLRAVTGPVSPSVSAASSRDVPSSEFAELQAPMLSRECENSRIYDWMRADDIPHILDEIPVEPRSSSTSAPSLPALAQTHNEPAQSVPQSSSRSTLSSEGFVRVDSGIVASLDEIARMNISINGENATDLEGVSSPQPPSGSTFRSQACVPVSLKAIPSDSTSKNMMLSIASVHPPPSYPPPPDHLSGKLQSMSSALSPPTSHQPLSPMRSAPGHSSSAIAGSPDTAQPSTLTEGQDLPFYPNAISNRMVPFRPSILSHQQSPAAVQSRSSLRCGSHGFDRIPSGASKALHLPHVLSLSGRVPSSKNAMSSSPSIERLAPDHFARTASVGFLSRNESAHSSQTPNPAPYNPAAALRVTFISVNSYGNTETSCDAEDVAYSGVAGGLLGALYGPSPSSAKRSSVLSNTFGRNISGFNNAKCSVAEAAGSLYRSGSVEDRWFFGQMVGEGAFSEVRLGEGRKGGGRVAIKIISKGAPDLFGPGGVCREVLAFQTIGRHPHIVECIEVFEDERFVYIVLELLTGGLLLPRIADAEQYYPQYDERSAAHVIRSMVGALAYCHGIGVAHRDVKPENMLFLCEGMDECIKLTDFGIAHCSDEPCTDLSGTPLYVAPEVLLRKPYGCAADMWSVGVIAHILLVGYPPFDDDNILQLINKVKYKPVHLYGPEWKMVTDQGRDFVSRLLVKDPVVRMTAADAQSHPWMSLTVQSECKVGVAWPLLVAAQRNIQEFVVHREFNRVIQHQNAESALKLAMLVSLSEKSLGDRDGAEQYGIFSESNQIPTPSLCGGVVSGGKASDDSSTADQVSFPVGYHSSMRGDSKVVRTPSFSARHESVHRSAVMDNAVNREMQEQAELRQRRLLYLEEKRLQGKLSDESERKGQGRCGTRTRQTRGTSTDMYEFDVIKSVDPWPPESVGHVDLYDTSPDLSAYAQREDGTFAKERRNADADADWELLRQNRSDKETAKRESLSNPPKQQVRRSSRWRRPPLFGGLNGARSKLDET